MAGDLDGGCEHRERARPPTVVAVERLIDDERFFGFAVTGHGEDLVVFPFVVAVAAGTQGGSWSGGRHGRWS